MEFGLMNAVARRLLDSLFGLFGYSKISIYKQ
ncbi:MAG: hypothetical protein ACJAWF_003775 [Candidatus Azotimanducaceae bacterium]|jgi:hypothetical protein